jgi:site-specific DNA-methyltransferase (adenine-specific)
MIDAGFYNMDCMDGMAQFPDKFFELAIIDPPYGIETRGHAQDRFRNGMQLDTVNDQKPNAKYFRDLFRVSKNQIIWGYNHLSDMLPKCREFVFWYKHQPVVTFADGELAWTSFQRTARCFDYPYFGGTNTEKDKIHPTQKPIALYKWLLYNYAKPGDKILDTHVGSASSLIACHQMGYEYWGFELDTDYFNAATERLNRAKAQVSMTELVKPIQARQIAIWGE